MSLLPEEFADLEPLAEQWALATETERNRRRLASRMSEVQALYDTLLPRTEAVLSYLGQFPLDNLPEGAERQTGRWAGCFHPRAPLHPRT